MFVATFNIVSIIYHTCAIGRKGQEGHGFCHFQKCFSHLPLICCRQGFQEAHVFASFNNVSVFYHSCAVGRAFRRLMCYATFNIVSVIYHTCAIGRGIKEAHVFCNFQ
jgi:hypothetical protein